MNIDKIVANVPDYRTFMTVSQLDESTMRLAARYPDVVQVFEAGKSSGGRSILCLKIGNGGSNALCVACPHPNEPIGAMTIEYLAQALAEDKEFRESTGYTWYMIKCADPDGLTLNEGWLKGPYTVTNYMHNYFRPGSERQVEWTFPVDYKELHFDSPMPETQAIMNIIERTKPVFLYSLHNGGLCGAYWYLTHQYEDIYDDLRNSAVKQGIPLQFGEPESPACIKFSDAIYKMEGISETYDYLERYTDEPAKLHCDGGTSSSDYALRYNDCVTLLTELPYFSDIRISDDSLTNISRRAAIEEKLKNTSAHYQSLDSQLMPVYGYLSEDNPFIGLVNQMIKDTPATAAAELKWAQQKEFESKAKVSEVFDNLVVSSFYDSLSTALAYRACIYEKEKADNSTVREKLSCAADQIGERLGRECRDLEKKLDYKFEPIKKLVAVQVESGLIVAKRRLLSR